MEQLKKNEGRILLGIIILLIFFKSCGLNRSIEDYNDNINKRLNKIDSTITIINYKMIDSNTIKNITNYVILTEQMKNKESKQPLNITINNPIKK